MLVLSRKAGQSLVIGGNVKVIVQRVSGNRVALAIEAPSEVSILRGELQEVRSEFQEEAEDSNEPPMLLDFTSAPESISEMTPRMAR